MRSDPLLPSPSSDGSSTTIASSATSVLIAHVAAHTSSIRLGAGGVMLPNHAPLLIAEQVGVRWNL